MTEYRPSPCELYFLQTKAFFIQSPAPNFVPVKISSQRNSYDIIRHFFADLATASEDFHDTGRVQACLKIAHKDGQ